MNVQMVDRYEQEAFLKNIEFLCPSRYRSGALFSQLRVEIAKKHVKRVRIHCHAISRSPRLLGELKCHVTQRKPRFASEKTENNSKQTF
jgi:hypothetical protein